MEIIIDTEKDSVDKIKQTIDILKDALDKKGSVYTNTPPSSVSSPSENFGFMNMFGANEELGSEQKEQEEKSELPTQFEGFGETDKENTNPIAFGEDDEDPEDEGEDEEDNAEITIIDY